MAIHCQTLTQSISIAAGKRVWASGAPPKVPPTARLSSRDGGLVFEQQREAFAELDDEAGPELTREVDFDEADVGAGKSTGWSRAWFGHPGEDAQSAADW